MRERAYRFAVGLIGGFVGTLIGCLIVITP
ncbi:hypothetical protein SEA_SADLAD_100 [Microbacterium phage SadLad]|nr:hypothetical protein SEA_SADLAD_100 [Microbacterium phage SadLad]